ncbi:copper resistance protein NlpE [Archangium sp.]|uniref:copper resistance protein NlpE n=1 Tax=Archangium sp. TaxID=1872627 RepID=UPI0038998D03
MPSISSRHSLVLPLIAALSLAACAHSQEPGTEANNSSDVAPTGRGGTGTTAIRARYEGVLPCADCTGIQTELMLLADGSYVIRETYQGKGDNAFESRGRYNVSSSGTQADANANVYVLTPSEGENRFFAAANGGQELRLLDSQKREIASQSPHTLMLTGGAPSQP